MKVIIDTNVIIDYLVERMPFANNSGRIIKLSELKKIYGTITASSATDIYYLMRKHVGAHRAVELLKALVSVVDIIDVSKQDILKAMELPIDDYEDALIAQCAKRIKAEYIITRNGKDFTHSSVPPITPENFLSRFFVE